MSITTKVNELPGDEAAQDVMFGKDGRALLVHSNVKGPHGLSFEDGNLVDTRERLKFAAGPVSIHSMPR